MPSRNITSLKTSSFSHRRGATKRFASASVGFCPERQTIVNTKSPLIVALAAPSKNRDNKGKKAEKETLERGTPLINCVAAIVDEERNQDELPGTNGIWEASNFDIHRSTPRPFIIKPSTTMMRINLRQQLQREQVEELAKKEKKLSTSVPTNSTSAIKVPSFPSSFSVQVPKQILKVKTQLVHPTAYHVEQSQKRQVQEYLSQSHHGAKMEVSSQIVNSLDPSPSSDMTALSSSAASPHELKEFWEDIDLSAHLNAIADSVADSGVEPNFNVTPTAVDSDIFDVLSLLPGLNNASASCPAKLADICETGDILIDEKMLAFQKDRQKKDNHNKIEKKRRIKINDRIKELAVLIPRSSDSHEFIKDGRQSKGSILKASVAYVKCLKGEVRKIPLLEDRCRSSERENKNLLLKIHDLEAMLKAHGIPVSQSMWYASSESDLNALMKQEPKCCSYSAAHASTQLSTVFSSQPLKDWTGKKRIGSHQVSSAPSNSNRVGYPIMQFLTVEQSHVLQTTPPPSSIASPGPSTSPNVPFPHVSTLEDLLMDDDQPVTGDPMLSSRNSFSPEHMDFMA